MTYKHWLLSTDFDILSPLLYDSTVLILLLVVLLLLSITVWVYHVKIAKFVF